MADDKRKRGRQDRAKASRSEDYEVDYLAREYRVSVAQARRVIKKFGGNRRKINAYLGGHEGTALRKRKKKRAA